MKTIEQRFQTEIEVERMKMALEQGNHFFPPLMAISGAIILSLWDSFSHTLLLLWFIVLNTCLLAIWICHYLYKKRINTINLEDVFKIKILYFLSGLSLGLCWGMGIILFADLAQPYTLVALTIGGYFTAVGCITLWFNYWPAVTAYTIPASGSFIILLSQQKDIMSLGLIFASTLSIVGCNIVSFKIRQTHTSALILNFENVALRQESEEARKAAEQANAAKTRFLAAASHDLRQPIHALGLFFAELSDRVRSPETNKLITQVDDSIIAINSMLNALLDVSKLDAGVVKPNVECFTLTALFARLESEFIPVALEDHNELRIRRTSVSVRSDPAMLERMLRNLIGNALKYTEHGRVLVAARPRGDNVEIQVFDNGSGIPNDQLNEIFIEFHQLGNPARDRRQGLGLGLAIVKRLANLLEHEIKVVSNLGRGCCFSITLPLVQGIQETPDEKLTNAAMVHSLAGYPVMILDDDIAVLEGMCGLLAQWGCQVITACSPTEAFDQLNTQLIKPKLLIVDYRLPDNVSGIEVAKELQNSLTSSVPVLIITGDTGPERLREADASGFPLLHKPVQPAKLRTTMQYLLGKKNTA